MRSAVLAAVALCVACAKDPTYATDAGGAAATDAGGAVASACPAVDAAVGVEAGGSAADAGINCSSSCDFAGGIAVGCATRFQYGINFAWDQFAGDFGGVSAFGAPGVSRNGRVACELADMRAHGVDTIRWWVWPDFRGDGVAFDSTGMPLGLGGTTLADVDRALALAAETGIHIQFCMFSFDNFRPDRTLSSGRLIRGIRSIILDDAKRAALMATAVRPFVRAVSASPHAARAVAWDVINEPEWAISGSDAYGDVAFTPQSTLETVTHAEMETFVRDTIAAIRAESSLPVTVGSAAAKWPRAWSGVDVDFHSIHIYDWVNMLLALQRLRERARNHGQAGGDGRVPRQRADRHPLQPDAGELVRQRLRGRARLGGQRRRQQPGAQLVDGKGGGEDVRGREGVSDSYDGLTQFLPVLGIHGEVTGATSGAGAGGGAAARRAPLIAAAASGLP